METFSFSMKMRVPVGTVCNFPRNALCTVDLGGKGGTSLSSPLVPDLISGKVWGRQTDREEFLPERCL